MTSHEGTRYYGATRSTCPVCRRVVQARYVGRPEGAVLESHCPDHGVTTALIYDDETAWLDARAYCKPGTEPALFDSWTSRGCPDDCGFCPSHEQHVCMPIVEITDRCDMACPVCLVGSHGTKDMTFDELRTLVGRLVESEGSIQVLSLSGGEPTLHPEYRRMVEWLTSVEQILRVSVSTNGLSLARDPSLRAFHRAHDVVVSLQFDGFRPATWERTRGRPELARVKTELLRTMADEGLAASLTVTAMRGVNEDELGPILALYLDHDNLLSLTVQPFAHVGDGCRLPHDPMDRVTIPEVIRRLSEGSSGILTPDDFTPLPCCDPTCFALTFLLQVEGGGWLPVKRLLPVDDYLDLIRNRSYMSPDDENRDHLKDLMYELWSGPAANLPQSEGALRTMRGILREIDRQGGAPKTAVRVAERRMKSVYVHQFMDPETFDVSRVRRCCTVYARADGRQYPMCVYNVLRRGRGGARP